MHTVPSRFVILACFALGTVCGVVLRLPTGFTWAEEPGAIQPAVAEPALKKLAPMTQTDHLRRAAEHLEAAGEIGLAQHVRQLASRPERLSRSTASPYYDGAATPQPPARLPAPSPRWTMQSELPTELDDGHLRFVQPARNQVESREARAVPAPQRDPI